MYIFNNNKVESKTQTTYFECDCQSVEHVLRFCHKEKWEDIYVDVWLNNRLNFFRRLWIATRYLFKLPLGHWEYSEVTIINKSRIPELIKMLEGIQDNV